MPPSARDWKMTDAGSRPAWGREGAVFSIWISSGAARGPDTGSPWPGSGPGIGAGSGGPKRSGVGLGMGIGLGLGIGVGLDLGDGRGFMAWLQPHAATTSSATTARRSAVRLELI